MKHLLTILALALLATVACKKNDDTTPTPSNRATVTYTLISGNDCFVTWRQNGVDSSASHVAAPWSKSFTDTIGSLLKISAMNTDTVSQYISVSISANGLKQFGRTCFINSTVLLEDTL